MEIRSGASGLGMAIADQPLGIVGQERVYLLVGQGRVTIGLISCRMQFTFSVCGKIDRRWDSWCTQHQVLSFPLTSCLEMETICSSVRVNRQGSKVVSAGC